MINLSYSYTWNFLNHPCFISALIQLVLQNGYLEVNFHLPFSFRIEHAYSWYEQASFDYLCTNLYLLQEECRLHFQIIPAYLTVPARLYCKKNKILDKCFYTTSLFVLTLVLLWRQKLAAYLLLPLGNGVLQSVLIQEPYPFHHLSCFHTSFFSQSNTGEIISTFSLLRQLEVTASSNLPAELLV